MSTLPLEHSVTVSNKVDRDYPALTETHVLENATYQTLGRARGVLLRRGKKDCRDLEGQGHCRQILWELTESESTTREPTWDPPWPPIYM